MPIPIASVVAAEIAADLGNADPESLAAFTAICERILAAVKAATVTVPGAGLATPPGGGAVSGVAIGVVS